MPLTHLQRLEAESIHILREAVAQAERPVMLYSVGKDSAVLLHLAIKAFHPAPPPFPLLHVDTTWKFRAMYELRDRAAAAAGMELIVHRNPDALARGINPFDHGALHTDLWKTEGLKQALDAGRFDAAFAGARRDEETSRAKERIVSVRSAAHGWDPKNQRPELWHLYNARHGPGESVRVFPLSDWTERDIWQYILAEGIEVVPLYLSAPRPTVERDGQILMVDDDRFRLAPGEVPVERSIRFRTLGCYPLTGAVESEARTLPEVVGEMMAPPGPPSARDARSTATERARWSARSARAISDGRRRARRIDRSRGRAGLAALHHLRIGGRRQVHADRPLAARCPRGGSPISSRPWRRTAGGSARRGMRSTMRCWSTDWPPSASRALPSTSLTAISPRPCGPSSSPTRRGMSSTPETWRPRASNADLAVILVDARKGVLTQTRRHSHIVRADGRSASGAGGEQDGPDRP